MKTTSSKYYIEGMHCPSCELLIEKKILDLKGVHAVDASLSNQSVRIDCEKGTHITLEKLEGIGKDLGYTFYTKKPQPRQQKIFNARGGQGEGVDINWKVLKKKLEPLWVVLFLAIGFYAIDSLQLGRFMNTSGSQSIFGIIVLGAVASVSSCAALIGGLLLSLTKGWHEQSIGENVVVRSMPHVQFHLGRVVGFFILGASLGGLGSIVSLDNTARYAGLVIIVSVVMVILALQMLDVKFAQKLRFRLPKALSKKITDKEGNNRGPFLIGAGTFFLPCGFTLIAQGAALASGSAIIGALMMSAFVFGTLPALIGISVFGLQMNKKPHLTAKFNMYAGLLVLLFAFYNINGQLNVLGVSSASDLFAQSNQQQEVIEQVGDEQIISLVAKGFEYIPKSSMTIKAGVPTVLEVDNQGVLGCGAYLSVFGLMDGFTALNRGSNTIDLGKPKKGRYKITCSMGMVAPVILVVK